MHAFAARRFGAEAARAIVAPFVTGVFAADSHDISLEAGFPRLAALEAEGGAGARRREADGARALGAVDRQADIETPRGMYAPAGGLGRARRRARCVARRSRSQTGCASSRSPPRPVACSSTASATTARCSRSRRRRPPSSSIDAMPELATRLRAFRPRADRDRLPRRAARARCRARSDGFGFLVAPARTLRVLGVVFETTVWPDRAPAGQTLLRCIFGGGARSVGGSARRRGAGRARAARRRAACSARSGSSRPMRAS